MEAEDPALLLPSARCFSPAHPILLGEFCLLSLGRQGTPDVPGSTCGKSHWSARLPPRRVSLHIARPSLSSRTPHAFLGMGALSLGTALVVLPQTSCGHILPSPGPSSYSGRSSRSSRGRCPRIVPGDPAQPSKPEGAVNVRGHS